MVAIVAGNGLGLFNASLNILGSGGVLGQSVLGHAGGRSFVNAATGNLILQFQDELLSGRGSDLHHLRTYNSLGLLNDGDQDGWRWGYEQTVRLTAGTINQSGSQVTRTDGDGHETVFAWNGSQYVSSEGAGAHDTLTYDAAQQQWVWVEGSTQLVETYSDSTAATMTGRLIKRADTSGNSIAFTYDSAGRLAGVRDTGSQQEIKLTYAQFGDHTRLQMIETRALNDNGALGTLMKQVEYGYTNGRLTMVRTDLTEDGASSDGVSYITNYTYNTNGRIASITQSDGSSVFFTYDNDGKVATVRDSSSVTAAVQLEFNYGTNQTTITDGNGQVWTYKYDATTKQLTEVLTPTVGGAQLSTRFEYDANGNVTRIIDARNNAVIYGYDANGNRTLEQDALGNTVTRTFNTLNQVVTETRYKTPDTDGNPDTVTASNPLTTRFVYDSNSRLRFVISAEGRVTENRYDVGAGLLKHTIQYTGSVYDLSALGTTAVLTQSQLENWVAALTDKSKVQLTSFDYDLRGNLSRQTNYANVDAAGAGVLDAMASVTEYTYDPHGQLLQTIAVRGANRDQRTTLTSYGYDGLGRVLTSTNSSGTQTTVYDGANRQIRVTSTAGLVETRSYDAQGRLVSVSQTGDNTTRQTQYIYDSANQLRMVQDAQGNRRFSFYDAAGRLTFTVDSTGAVTRLEYNTTGQVTKQTQFAAGVTQPAIGGWYDATTNTVTKLGLAVGADFAADTAYDRVTSYTYDAAGRLETMTDAANAVTTTRYDGLSRVTMMQTGDRVTRYLYDNDSRKVGMVDALGYLTEYKYDAGGRIVETVRYSTRSPAAANMTAPIWIGVTNQTAAGGQPFEYRVPAYDADGDSLSYSVVGNLPPWLTLDTSTATPTLRGTPPTTLTSYSVTLRANDGRGKTSDVTLSIAVVASVPGSAGQSGGPSWVSLLPLDVLTNTTVSHVVPAASDKSSLSYSVVSGMPPGLSFNPMTRTISGSSNAIGFYTIVLRVTTAGGQTVDRTLSVQIRSAATAPAQQPGSDQLSAWRPTIATGLRSFVYYDARGRVVGSVDEQQFLTETTYDEQLNTQKTLRYLTPVTVGTSDTLSSLRARAGAVRQTSLTQYDGFGRVSEITALDGTTRARSEYDAAGRLARVVTAVGTAEQRASRTFYNAFGEVIATLGGEGDAWLGTNPTQQRTSDAIRDYGTRYEHDTLGRTVRSIDANGNKTLFYYDRESRLTHTVHVLDQASRLTGEVSETKYNRFGQVESVRRYAAWIPGTDMEQLLASGGGGFADQTFLNTVAALGNASFDQRTSYEYDRRGLLVKQIDGENGTTTNHYDVFGQLAAQVRTILQGRTTTTQYGYDLQGRLLSQTGDVGGINSNSRIAYDAFGRVTQSVNGAGKVITTSYLDSGRTIVVTDPLNRAASTEYDALGRVLRVTDALNPPTVYSYNEAARSVTVTTPEGVQLTTTRTRHGETLNVADGRGNVTRYAYNKDGQLTTVTDALDQVVSTKAYDKSGRLFETTDARGTVTRFSYDQRNRVFERRVDPAGLNLTTLYQFDALGQQIKVTEGVSGAVAKATDYIYDRNGRLTQVIVDPGTAGLQLSTRYHYDDLNNTVKVARGTVASPNQQVTLYQFDSLGRRIREIAAPSSEVGAGAPGTRDRTTQYRFDAAGRVSRRIDANGQSTWYVYDAAGQQTHVISALGEVSESRYDASGRLVHGHRYLNRLDASTVNGFGDVVSTLASPAIDAGDQRQYTVYDNDGRMRFTVKAGAGSSWAISENRYDANGNVIESRRYDKLLPDARIAALDSITSPGLTATEIQSELSSTLGYNDGDPSTLTSVQRARFAYDANNRLRFTVDALGSINESVYDASGNVVSTVRFAARPTLSSYTESAIDAVVNRSDANNQVTRFAYDTNNRLRFTVDALGSVSEAAYDALGKVVSTVRFAARPTLSSYTESAINAVVNRSDANNQVTRFAYDTNDRLRFTVDALGSVSESTYDALGNVVSTVRFAARPTLTTYTESAINTAVNPLRSSADNQVTRFAYDADNRLRFTVDALGSISEIVYDALSNVVSTVRFATRPPLTAYTESAITTAVNPLRSSADNQVTRFAYDRDGRLRFTVDALGSVSETVYDALGHVVSTIRFAARPTLSTPYTESSINTAVSSLRGDTDNQITRFAYDRDGRLRFTVDALGSVSERTYDALGNVVSTMRFAARPTLSTYTASAIDAVVNPLRSDTRNQVTRFAYDADNRLRFTVDALGSISESVYDVLGNLVSTVRFAPQPMLMEFSESAIDAAVDRSDANNQIMRFAYDRDGRLRFTVDVLGSISESVYDVLGNLVSAVRFAARPTLSTFTESAIEGAVNRSDSNNQVTRFAYDRDGRLRFTVDALGSISETVYDALGNVASTIRFAARPALSSYTASEIDTAVNALRSDAGNQVMRFAYDRDGRLRFTVDAIGSVSETVYDALGNVARTIRFAARPELSSYTESAIDTAVNPLRSAASNQITRFAYDASNRLRFTVDALGSISETVYDALGNMASTVRFAARPTLSAYSESAINTAVDPLRSNADNQVTRFAYDGDNRLRFTVDALGSVSEIVYDALGHVVSTMRFAARPTLSTTYTESAINTAVNSLRGDANNQVTRFAYDRDGRLRFTVDELGSISESVYDSLGNVVRTVRFAARPTLSTTYTESAINAAVNALRNDANNQITRFAYDAGNRLRFTVDAPGSISETVYDALGNVASTIRFAAPPTLSSYTASAIDAAVSSLRSDANNQITRFAYDADNRLRFTVDALGSISETVYDALGNITSTVRFAGRPTLSAYSESAIDAAVNPLRSNADNQVARFAYDGDNRLRYTVDALGSVSETVYDALGNVASTMRFAALPTLSSYTESEINTAVESLRDDADNQITRFVYDANNRLRFTVDALGSISETVYGVLGNVVSTVRFAARPALPAFTEIAIDGVVDRNDVNNQVTRFAYDKDGRLRFVVDALGSIGETVYDALGNVVSVTRFAARPTLTQNQYSESAIDAVVNRNDAGNQITRFAYDAAGRQIFSVRAVSVDSLGQVKYQVKRQELNALGQVVRSTAFAAAVTLSAYDEATIAAAVNAVADVAKDRTSGFAYDTAGRLIYTVQVLSAGKHQVVKQEYDAQGRVFKTTGYVREVGALANFNKGTIDTAVNAIVDANDRRTQYVYDAAGYQRFVLQADNVTRWTIGENRYDAKGNLIESRRYDQFVADTWITATDTASSPGITQQEMSAKLSALGYDDSTPGTLADVRRTRFAYDAQSQLRFEIDALGAVSERTYNALGQLFSSMRYAATPVLTAYDESAINAAVAGARNNADNQLQQYAYSAVGQLRFSLQVLKPNVGTGGEHRVSEQRYDALGQLVETRVYATAVRHLNGYGEQTIAASIIASDQDRRSAIAYDANGRQVYTAQELQVGSVTKYVVTRHVYDALGQMVQRIGYATPVALADFAKSTIDGAIVASSSNDRTTTYVHDAAGRLRFEVASDSSFRETVYDALNQVTQTRQFDFKLTGNPLRTEAEMITLRGNRVVGDGVTRGELRDYDAAGRLSSVTDALSNIEHFEYNAPGERIKWTDKNGHIWTYEYDRKGQRFKEISPPLQFKLSGEPVGTPAPERSLETRFEFDAFGNVKQKVEAANFANDARTTDFSYDTLGRLKSTLHHGYYDAGTGRVERDPGANRFRRETTTTYDTLGNAVRSSTRTGVNTVQHQYRTYNNLGELRHEVNALNHVTGYTYTSFGEAQTVTRYSVTIAGTPADGVSWTAGEIDARLNHGLDENGNPIPDNLARITTLAYDDLGRKISVTEPTAAYYSTHVPGSAGNPFRPNPYSVSGVQDAALTKFEYNVFGDMTLQQVRVNNIVEWQDTSFTYDAMGRRSGSVDAAGFVTFWEYDAAGNLERTGELTGNFDGSDRITEFAYNLLNQQTSVERFGLRYTDADGNDRGRAYWNGSEWVDVDADVATTVRTTTYDGYGRVRTTTDGLGNVTTMKYNALGQLERITEPARIVAPLNANDGDVDPFRNQVSESPVTVLTLDAFGNAIRQLRTTSQAQDSRETLLSYDAADNLISSPDAELNVKVRFYDYAGRVTKETQAINSNLGPVLGINTQGLERRYSYDAIGRRTDTLDVYQDGDTLKQSGQSVVYNAFGEVIEDLRKWGLASQDSASLDTAKVASFHRDNAGHVFEKIAGDGLTAYFYNLQGQVTREEKRGNSVTSDGTDKRITETEYDVLGRAIMIRKPGFNADLSIGSELQQGFVTPYSKMSLDRWGNVVNYEEGGYEFVDGHERFAPNRLFRSYQYDDNNQLISETLGTHGFVSESGTGSSALVYKKLYRDLSGNVVKEVDEARNLQTDALLSSRTRRREYNSVGQLTAQIDASTTPVRTEYAYNIHGDRLGTRNAEGTVTFDQYDRNGNVLFHGVLRTIGPNGVGKYNSFTGEGTITRTHLNAYLYDQANRRFASKTFTDGTGAPWSFTRFDARNFGIEHRDENGVIKRCSYDEFGNKSLEIDGANGRQEWHAATADYVVGRVTSYNYGIRGGSYQYNDFGEIARHVKGNSVTQYGYHGNGLTRTINITPDATVANGTETTVYDYDARGQLTIESRSDSGSIYAKNIAYDNQGRIARVEQIAIPSASTPNSDVSYSYDAFGNIRRIQATYMQTAAEGLRSSDSWFKYDAAGRMTLANGRLVDGVISLKERTPGSVKIAYDDVGRRSMTTEFVRDNHTQNSAVDRKWDTLRDERYTYNDLGQLQMTEQRFRHVNIVAQWLNGFASPGEAGFVLIDDEAAPEAQKVPTEDDPPPPPPDDDDGPDPSEPQNEADRFGRWQTLSTRVTNLRGDVTRGEQWDRIDGNLNSLDVSETAAHSSITNTEYRADGQVDWTETIDDDPNRSTMTVNTYDPKSGQLKSYLFTAYNSANTQYNATFTYQYTFQNGNWAVKSINDAYYGLDTVKSYDDLGRVYYERIDIAKPNGGGSDRYEERRYKYDAQGRIIVKDSTLRVGVGGGNTEDLPTPSEGLQVYVYAGDRTIATVGNGRLAAGTKFDFAYTPMSEAATSGATGYVVQSGDTLIDIAQKVYGDGALWYIIADANGVAVGPHDPLSTAEIGKAYDIPSVMRHANSAGTFKPYNPAEIIGNDRPVAAAPPPPPRCSEIGTQLAQMVIIAVSMTVKYGSTALLTYFGVPAPLASGIGSGAGNLAGQGTAWALGMQEEGKEGIDWDEVALATAEGYFFSVAGTVPKDASTQYRVATQSDVSFFKEVWQQNKTGFEDWRSFSGVGSSLFGMRMSSLSPMLGDTATGLAQFGVNGVVNSASPNSGWAAASGQRSSLVSGFEFAFGAFAIGAAEKTYEWIREQMKKPSGPRSVDDPRGPLPEELLDEWDERDAVHGRILDHLDKQSRENEPIAQAGRRNLAFQLEMAGLQDRIDHLGEGIDKRAVMKYALNANNRERFARHEAAAARAQAREAMFNARAARLDAQMKAGQRDYLAQIESDMNESLHIIAQDMYDEGTLTRVSDNIDVDGVKAEMSSGVYDPQMIFSDRPRNWELDVAVDWFKNNSKKHDMKMHEVIGVEHISSSAEKARRAGLRMMATFEQHKQIYFLNHGTLEGAPGRESALEQFNSDRARLSKDVNANDYRMGNAFATANFITTLLPGLALGPISTLASMGVGYGTTKGLEELGVAPGTAGKVGLFAGMFVAGAVRGGGWRLVDDLNSGGLMRGLSTATIGSAVIDGLERAGVDQEVAGVLGGLVGGVVGGMSVKDLTRPSGSVERLLAAQRAARASALGVTRGEINVSSQVRMGSEDWSITFGEKEPTVFVRFDERTFATMEEAGEQAVRTWNPDSIAHGHEFAGKLFATRDGRYGYTGPVMDLHNSKNFSDNAMAPVHPDWGVPAAGDWHTHGNHLSAGELYSHKNPVLVPVAGEANNYKWQFPNGETFNPNQFSVPDLQGGFLMAEGLGGPYTRFLGAPGGDLRSLTVTPDYHFVDRLLFTPRVMGDPALPPASRSLPVAGESPALRPEQPALISAPTGRDVFFAIGVTQPVAATAVPGGGGALSGFEHLGHGFFKDVYEYGDGRAIAVLKPDKMIHSGAITEELENLARVRELFADTDLPHVNASGPVWIDGRPAIVMDRFAQGSKKFVEVADHDGRFEVFADSPYLNKQSLQDLATIRNTLIAKKADIPDLQFLIAHNGRLTVADPLGPPHFSPFAPSRSHLQLIEKMEEAARRSIYLETGLSTLGGLHKKTSNDGYW